MRIIARTSQPNIYRFLPAIVSVFLHVVLLDNDGPMYRKLYCCGNKKFSPNAIGVPFPTLNVSSVSLNLVSQSPLAFPLYSRPRAICLETLREKNIVPDRFEGMGDYTIANTRPLCRTCDWKVQEERMFS